MFCSKCGAENEEGTQFCKECGAPLGSDRPVASGSTTTMDPKIAGLLCYLVGWITGLIFILIEKENDFVRFHAMQSIVVFGVFTILQIILSILGLIPYIWILFYIISILLGIAAFVLWIFLMVKAYQGERYRVPYAADFAEKHI
ncbi:MAG: DUF4870 domain-containing protein [Dehalococcoidia bacterium]